MAILYGQAANMNTNRWMWMSAKAHPSFSLDIRPINVNECVWIVPGTYQED